MARAGAFTHRGGRARSRAERRPAPRVHRRLPRSWPRDGGTADVITVDRSVQVYRNPRPELVARHAWHPSLIRLNGDEWLCTFDVGQGPEAHDYVSYVSRSLDTGKTWSDPTPMLAPEPPPRATHTVRVARLRNGTLLGFGARFVRGDVNQG